MSEGYGYYVGVDWGSAEHFCVVLNAKGEQVAERTVRHEGVDIGEWIAWLEQLGPTAEMAIGIEVPRGPLVEALLERGFHVHAVNPKQLDRFRDRHTVAGAKDDRLDAFVIADSLRTDRRRFRRLRVDDPAIVELREADGLHHELTEELGRLSNQLREQLWRYYVQPLALCPAANEPWLWDLLEQAITPERVGVLSPRTVAKLLKKHRIRRLQPEAVWAKLREPSLPVSSATVRAVSGHVLLLLPRLRLIHAQLAQTDKQIAALLDELGTPPRDGGSADRPTDVAIVLSATGVGTSVCAALFGYAAVAVAERDLETLRTHAGVAPVTRQSGKRRYVVMRRACEPRLRNALWHWARVYAQRDPHGKAVYRRMRERGRSHATALRQIGDQLLRMLVAMLRNGTLYDPQRLLRTQDAR